MSMQIPVHCDKCEAFRSMSTWSQSQNDYALIRAAIRKSLADKCGRREGCPHAFVACELKRLDSDGGYAEYTNTSNGRG